ncbi:MAG: CorA family divalent cation transporter [Clostridia bacterium]
MMYTFNGEMQQTCPCNLDPNVLTAGLIGLDELKNCNHIFGLDAASIKECESDSNRNSFRTGIDVYDDCFFSILNIVDVNDVLAEEDRIGIYIKKNLFLLIDIVDADNSTRSLFEYAASRFKPQKMTLEKLVFSLFDRLLYKDSEALEALEFRIGGMEDELSGCRIDKDFNNRLLTAKKRMLVLRSYYEQLVNICEELAENENGVLNAQALRYFKLLGDRVSRLSANVQMLRDNLVQVREAYQAALDYDLNRIMKVFTVVTTIFMPLTLITSWYGMNFTSMPEITWGYGYIFVIILCIAVAVLSIVFFKRKKFM